MNRSRPPAGPAPDWGPLVRRRATRLGIGAGEATELLQRLPPAARGPGDAPNSGVSGRLAARALDALETYAARKRAAARLARLGHL